MQLLTLWQMTKFHAQIWQFEKMAHISETAASRAKISSISNPWSRKGVYVELWQMDKMVLKKSVKAHGPLVGHSVHFQVSLTVYML